MWEKITLRQEEIEFVDFYYFLKKKIKKLQIYEIAVKFLFEVLFC